MTDLRPGMFVINAYLSSMIFISGAVDIYDLVDSSANNLTGCRAITRRDSNSLFLAAMIFSCSAHTPTHWHRARVVDERDFGRHGSRFQHSRSGTRYDVRGTTGGFAVFLPCLLCHPAPRLVTCPPGIPANSTRCFSAGKRRAVRPGNRILPAASPHAKPRWASSDSNSHHRSNTPPSTSPAAQQPRRAGDGVLCSVPGFSLLYRIFSSPRGPPHRSIFTSHDSMIHSISDTNQIFPALHGSFNLGI